RSGNLLEAMGRKTAFHAAIRFLSLSDVQKEHARLKLEHQRLLGDNESLLALADALDMPIWLRDKAGRLIWVNNAYAKAVDGEGPEEAIREGRELLPTAAREDIARDHLARAVFNGPVSTVVGGERRIYTITEASS